jgi:acyl-homoserine lactone acylase PvdQ
MVGASQIQFTFNWLYADNRDIAYYVSGLDPVRAPGVDPNLPTWGTGVAEWQGFLAPYAHPHEINPPQGFFTSWNNKPAPGFGAADNEYGYGPVYRSQMLTDEIRRQLAQHGGRLTRADLVSAMELGASSDLNGRYVLPELLADVRGRPEPPGVSSMLDVLGRWSAGGAHRRKAQAGDAQYAEAAAVAAMDELFPRLVGVAFDSVFAAGGVSHEDGSATGYDVVPMEFVNAPHNHGGRLGSAYDGGWDGYLVKFLRQLRGAPVAQPFPADVMTRLCGGRAPSGCLAALDTVLAQAYQALRAANGGTSTVSRWTQDTATRLTGQSMPAYDAIGFRAVGIVGQPNMAWQNRPTFQQVVEFPAHRPR